MNFKKNNMENKEKPIIKPQEYSKQKSDVNSKEKNQIHKREYVPKRPSGEPTKSTR